MRLCAIFALLAAAIPAQNTAPPLRVAYTHFPPYSIVQSDGSPAGFVYDLVNEAARQTGLRLQWVHRDINAFESLRSGAIDLWPMMAALPARRGQVDMSQPWWENSLVLVSPGHHPIRTERDARGKRIGLLQLSFRVDRLTERFPGAIPVPRHEYSDIAQAVCRGSVDAGLLDSRLAAALPLLEACKNQHLTLEWISDFNVSYVIGARPGLQNTADRLFDELLRMSRDGRMTRLGAPWGLAAPNQYQSLLRLAQTEQQRRGLLWAIALGVLLVLALSAAIWKLRQAGHTARRALEARSRFMANVSHEIRTPLHGVIGTAEMLARLPLGDNERDLVSTIQDCSRLLLRQINDLLDLAKLEAGRVDFERLVFAPADIVQSAVEAFQAQASGKGLELTAECSVPGWAWGDPTRLKQIVFNLTSNAVKFTAAGSVVVRASVSPAGRLCFSVRDTGPGIDEETQARLFQPFAQADESVARRYGGTGLGLAICRELAHAMKGELSVVSEPGQGSEFWLELPLEPAPEPAPVQAAPLRQVERRVLIVEDNPVNRRIAKAALESLGCQVLVATGGLEALDLLERERVDLVFMDCHMPELDGFATTRRIRSMPGITGQLPIVALTAAAFEEDRRAAREAGMDDLVPKPFDLDRLRRALDRWSSAAARV